MSRFQEALVKWSALLTKWNNLKVKKSTGDKTNRPPVMSWSVNKCSSVFVKIKRKSQRGGAARHPPIWAHWYSCWKGFQMLLGNPFFFVQSLMNLNEIHMCFEFVSWLAWANGTPTWDYTRCHLYKTPTVSFVIRFGLLEVLHLRLLKNKFWLLPSESLESGKWLRSEWFLLEQNMLTKTAGYIQLILISRAFLFWL